MGIPRVAVVGACSSGGWRNIQMWVGGAGDVDLQKTRHHPMTPCS